MICWHCAKKRLYNRHARAQGGGVLAIVSQMEKNRLYRNFDRESNMVLRAFAPDVCFCTNEAPREK